MWRLLKWLFVLLLVAGALVAMSYAGARATTRQFLGRDPPVSNRAITFAYQGVPSLPGKPRAWVITFRGTRLRGVPRAVIYVSLTGKLITTVPADLDQRIEAWEKAQEP